MIFTETNNNLSFLMQERRRRNEEKISGVKKEALPIDYMLGRAINEVWNSLALQLFNISEQKIETPLVFLIKKPINSDTLGYCFNDTGGRSIIVLYDVETSVLEAELRKHGYIFNSEQLKQLRAYVLSTVFAHESYHATGKFVEAMVAEGANVYWQMKKGFAVQRVGLDLTSCLYDALEEGLAYQMQFEQTGTVLWRLFPEIYQFDQKLREKTIRLYKEGRGLFTLPTLPRDAVLFSLENLMPSSSIVISRPHSCYLIRRLNITSLGRFTALSHKVRLGLIPEDSFSRMAHTWLKMALDKNRRNMISLKEVPFLTEEKCWQLFAEIPSVLFTVKGAG